MKRISTLGLAALSFALIIVGCKKKDDDHSHGDGGGSPIQMRWVSLGHGHDAQDRYHVDLEAELPVGQDTLTEGYYRFRAKIMRNGSLYGGSDVRFLPMMYMTDHSHSCPTEQPMGPSQDGYYYGAAFFMMPTMMGQPWKMHVKIGATDSVSFTIQVNPHPRGWVRRGRQFGNPNNPRYLYEMKLPRAGVGAQDVSFYVYKRDMAQPATDPAAFPAATNITQIDLETWMPSMSHGGGPGTRSAMPVQGKPGRLDGKVDFNMSGDWWVIATFKEGNNVIGKDTFALEF
ncbi:MAG: hypothetical protein ABDH66_06140 [Bacteroidia bacterium]